MIFHSFDEIQFQFNPVDGAMETFAFTFLEQN